MTVPTKSEIELENDRLRDDLRQAMENLNRTEGERVAEFNRRVAAEAALPVEGYAGELELVPCPELPAELVPSWTNPDLLELAALARVPFPASSIGKLPRSNCKDCSAMKYGACTKHEYRWCDVCKGKHTTAAIHIDFVGHAPLTARLLDLDPGWSWEPVAWADDGFPLIEWGQSKAVMWIWLTVRGVRRLGVGTAPRTQDEVHKELIGDALRNAGMRFGLALDLWSKGDLVAGFGMDEPDPPAPAPAPAPPVATPAAAPPPVPAAAPPTETAATPDPGPADGPPAVPAPIPAEPPPAAPVAATGPAGGESGADLRTRFVMPTFLTLKGADAKRARDELQSADLWPLLDVPDDRVIEVAAILEEITGKAWN